MPNLMISTRISGMQALKELIHEILYLTLMAIPVFGEWIGALLHITSKALNRLYAYSTRLLKKPSPQPFRFLDLPPELRNLVYDHHFTLYKTPWYWQKAREMAMLPDAILIVNRQIYEEASHALYSGVSFVIMITGTANRHGDERLFARVLGKIPRVLKHVKSVCLEICWPREGWYQRDGCVTQLKRNIETVCKSLAKLPNLRTVKIIFLVEESWDSLVPLSPPKYRVPGLLRPLKRIRRANPGVVVEMPDLCPISTEELAEQQQEGPYGPELKETKEDILETLGDWMAIQESLG